MTGIHLASKPHEQPGFCHAQRVAPRQKDGYGPAMTKTQKLVAVLSIVGASLGAAAPSMVVAVSNSNGSSMEAIGKLGGGRAVDPINAIGKLGGGRAVDPINAIGKLGGGSPSDAILSIGKLGGG